jgi:hypothetical protein
MNHDYTPTFSCTHEVSEADLGGIQAAIVPDGPIVHEEKTHSSSLEKLLHTQDQWQQRTNLEHIHQKIQSRSIFPSDIRDT